MPLAHVTISARRRQRISGVSFPELTLMRVHAGTKRAGHGAGKTEIREGEILAVTPGVSLQIENLPPSRHAPYVAQCLGIGNDMLRASARAPRRNRQAWAALRPTPALDQAWQHAIRGLEDGLPESLLRHRVGELLEALTLAGFTPILAREIGTAEQVRAILASDPARAWRAEAVAAGLAMSAATLRRKLAAEHASFRGIVQEVRLVHALMLLQGTRQPIQRVAMACGYTSTSRFAARFRDRFGTLPSELRT